MLYLGNSNNKAVVISPENIESHPFFIGHRFPIITNTGDITEVEKSRKIKKIFIGNHNNEAKEVYFYKTDSFLKININELHPFVNLYLNRFYKENIISQSEYLSAITSKGNNAKISFLYSDTFKYSDSKNILFKNNNIYYIDHNFVDTIKIDFMDMGSNNKYYEIYNTLNDGIIEYYGKENNISDENKIYLKISPKKILINNDIYLDHYTHVDIHNSFNGLITNELPTDLFINLRSNIINAEYTIVNSFNFKNAGIINASFLNSCCSNIKNPNFMAESFRIINSVQNSILLRSNMLYYDKYPSHHGSLINFDNRFSGLSDSFDSFGYVLNDIIYSLREYYNLNNIGCTVYAYRFIDSFTNEEFNDFCYNDTDDNIIIDELASRYPSVPELPVTASIQINFDEINDKKMYLREWIDNDYVICNKEDIDDIIGDIKTDLTPLAAKLPFKIYNL